MLLLAVCLIASAIAEERVIVTGGWKDQQVCLHSSIHEGEKCMRLESKLMAAAASSGIVVVGGWGPDKIYVLNNAGSLLQVIDCKEATVKLSFHPNGSHLFIAGFASGNMHVYERVEADHEVRYQQTLSWDAHYEWVTDIFWHANGETLFTSSLDNRIRAWNASKPDQPLFKSIKNNKEKTKGIFSITSPSNDDTIVYVGCGSGRIVEWNTKTRTHNDMLINNQINHHNSTVVALNVDKQGNVISGSEDQRIIQWENNKPKNVINLKTKINKMIVLEDGYLVATQGKAVLFDKESGAVIATYGSHEGPLFALAVSSISSGKATKEQENKKEEL